MRPDTKAEVLSLHGQADDVLRCIVSVAGWFRVRDAADGTALYDPSPTGPGMPLAEAAVVIVAEARSFGAASPRREETDQEVADGEGETSGVHTLSVQPRTARVEVP